MFHGYEFAWAKAHNPDLVPLVVTVYPDRPAAGLVVVHKDDAASLGDLKGGDVAVPRGTGPLLRVPGKQRAGGESAAPKAKRRRGGPRRGRHGTSPAALVDVRPWRVPEDPARRVQETAGPGRVRAFPQNVIAYNKGAITEQPPSSPEVLTEAHTTPGGKPLMMLWNIKGFDAIPADYDDHLDPSVKAYPAPAAPGRRCRDGRRRHSAGTPTERADPPHPRPAGVFAFPGRAAPAILGGGQSSGPGPTLTDLSGRRTGRDRMV